MPPQAPPLPVKRIGRFEPFVSRLRQNTTDIRAWLMRVAGRTRLPDPVFPFPRDFRHYAAAIPLKAEFRFAHEPVSRATSHRFVGREAELGAYVERILFSEGGSFLITGYRGVGKTSFVNRVIQRLEDALPWAEPLIGDVEILDIHINIARPMSPAELMHHLIRRIYEHLSIRGTLQQLDRELYDAIVVAYKRTSLNMTRKLADSSESTFGINELSVGAELLRATIKMSGSRKRSRTQNEEMSYLGYDDRAAEDDLIWISRRLARGYQKGARLKKLKIIFVFDELDKLEDQLTEKGDVVRPLDDLLRSLKNLFTTSGIIFIFVAGKDLQERWAEDLRKGDSVYESVFSHDTYLPCMWADVNELCKGMVDLDVVSVASDDLSVPPAPPQILGLACGHFSSAGSGSPFCPVCGRYLRDPLVASSAFSDFKDYLSYKGRGIPRRIIRAFNEYVVWESTRPCLVFGPQDLRRIRFYAELQRAIAEHSEILFSDVAEEVIHTQSDRQKLGVYYLMDWILRQGRSEFTKRDAIVASKELSAKIAPAEELAPRLVGNLFDVLTRQEYIVKVSKGLDQARIGDAEARSEQLFQLSGRRLAEMDGLAGVFEEEAHALSETGPTVGRIGPYELHDQIGSGGMGVVYRAWDPVNLRFAAVKKLSSALTNSPEAIERFKREADLLRSLTHPNVIQYLDAGEQGGEAYIAMELIEGVSLERVLKNHGPIPQAAALAIARQTAGAVAYIHEKDITRLDIKPLNILLRQDGHVYLTDFGTVRSANSDLNITVAGVLVGTPLYMAPEQFGDGPADARSDIYSYGAVLYEVLTGTVPFRGAEIIEIIRNQLEGAIDRISDVVDVSPQLEAIVMRCLARDPGERYQSMADVIQDLDGLGLSDDTVLLAEIIRSAKELGREVEKSTSSRTEVLSLSLLGVPPVAPLWSEDDRSLVPSEIIAAYVRSPAAPSPPVIDSSLDHPDGVEGASSDSESWPSPTPAPIPMAADSPPRAPTPNAAQPPSPAPFPPLTILPEEHEAPGPPAVEQSAGQARLVSVDAKGSQVIITLPVTARSRIGRSPDNEIQISDKASSRYHCEIFEREGAWRIRDLNSSNGTFVNGARVLNEVKLSEFDTIRIGDLQMRFEYSA